MWTLAILQPFDLFSRCMFKHILMATFCVDWQYYTFYETLHLVNLNKAVLSSKQQIKNMHKFH